MLISIAWVRGEMTGNSCIKRRLAGRSKRRHPRKFTYDFARVAEFRGFRDDTPKMVAITHN